MRQRMQHTLGLALVTALAFLTTTAASAQPMAELTPEDAILYLGWRGADDLGPDYAGSHLAGMVEQTGLLEALPQLLEALESFAQEQAPEEQLEIIAALTTVGESAWRGGAAMYVLPMEDLEQAGPMPRVAFLFRRGGVDEPGLRAALADLVRMANEAEQMPMFMGVTGEALFLSVGFDAAELAEGGKLPGNERFQQAMARVQGDAALTAYLNGEELIAQVDAVVQMMRDEAEEWDEDPNPMVEMWPTIRDATGLSGVRQLVMTAGLEGKNWQTRTFLDAPAPRVGLLSLIDAEPIQPEQLLHIPGSATYVQAGALDPARILEVTRDVLGAIDPGMVDELDNALEDANEAVGFDIEGQLINGMGPTWTAYIDPMIAGNGLASIVLVNELRDPARVTTALMRLCERGNEMIGEEMDEEGIKVRFLTRQINGRSVVSLGVPFVSPSWMVHEGKLYLALYPQALEMALGQSGERADSILANEAFRGAMARLGQGALVGVDDGPNAARPGATALSFTDLPETAPDGYGTMLMIAQVLGGAAEMTTGEPASFMLPPVGKLMPYLEPAGGAAWVDESGLHALSIEPFPGASLMGPGKGLESTTIVAAPVAVGVMLPALGAARQSARTAQTMAYVRQVTIGAMAYAVDNKDQMPQDIAHMIEQRYLGYDFLVTPGSQRAQPLPVNFEGWELERQMRFYRENSSFVLVPLGDMEEIERPSETILVFQRPDDANGWENGIAVGYADGHARWEWDVDWIAQQLQEQTGMTMDELIERQVAFEPAE